jgi:hypothetical protein
LIVGSFKSSRNYLVYSGREQVQQIIIIFNTPNNMDSFLSGEQFMYDDLGNQNLIVVLFIYNTRNIQVKY